MVFELQMCARVEKSVPKLSSKKSVLSSDLLIILEEARVFLVEIFKLSILSY